MRRVLACLAAALLLTACAGGDHKVDAGPTPGDPNTPAPVIPSARPTVTVPKGPPPTTLVKKDLIVGTGDFAIPGKTVSVMYVGVHYSTGKVFDTTWDTHHSLPFQLGAESVIAGWEEGVVGMRVGGRRELVIPPDLAYGATGDETGEIKPNETLVFVVDLVGVGGTPAGVGGTPPQ